MSLNFSESVVGRVQPLNRVMASQDLKTLGSTGCGDTLCVAVSAGLFIYVNKLVLFPII